MKLCIEQLNLRLFFSELPRLSLGTINPDGTNRDEAMRNMAQNGLTAEHANWQPPNGGHSAGQLAYHLLFWNRRNLNNLQGIKNDKFTGDNKETFDKFDSKQWADIGSQLDQVMTDLEKLVESADTSSSRSERTPLATSAPTTRITSARSYTCASCKVAGIRTRA